MKSLLRHIKPPDRWKIPVVIISGIFFGLSAYMFYISKAHSYLSDSPATCVNCHIMAPQYATWQHSSHRENATCNDCHVPHNNVFNKYYFKGKDGLRHATMFTLRLEPQVITIKDEGKHVVQQNCVRCHENMITDIEQNTINPHFQYYRENRNCTECHREVPHGRVNSLSSTPNAKVPIPESPVPEWLKEIMKNENTLMNNVPQKSLRHTEKKQ